MELKNTYCYVTGNTNIVTHLEKKFKRGKQTLYSTGKYKRALEYLPSYEFRDTYNFIEAIKNNYFHIHVNSMDILIKLEILDWNTTKKVIYFDNMEITELEENEEVTVKGGIRIVTFDFSDRTEVPF